MKKTKITWTDYTLNVVLGCSKPAAVPPHVQAELGITADPKWAKSDSSPECQRCYAEFQSYERFKRSKHPWMEANEAENVQLRPNKLRDILKIQVEPVHLPPSQRAKFFVCSMGDIFHRLVPDEFLHQCFEAMAQTPHIYMLLTKRPERAVQWPGPWPENIWLGTTAGHPVTKWRMEYLRRSKAQTRFVSMEPMLAGMMPLDLAGIDMVIVGGESGTGFRKMDMQWAREVRDACATQNVAFFFKQDAAFREGQRQYLVEADGRCMQYRQYPGELTPPIELGAVRTNDANHDPELVQLTI